MSIIRLGLKGEGREENAFRHTKTKMPKIAKALILHHHEMRLEHGVRLSYTVARGLETGSASSEHGL